MEICAFFANMPKKLVAFYFGCILVTVIAIPADYLTIKFTFCVGCFTISAFLLSLFPQKKNRIYLHQGSLLYGVLLSGFSAAVSAVALTLIYQCAVLGDYGFSTLLAPAGLVRIYLLFWPMNLVNCFVIFDAKKVADILFKYRWLVAFFFAAILILAKVHFYNISCFSYYIQPEHQTAFTMPVFGTPRGIRSDEWLVNIPRNIVSGHSGYGKYNYILRGTENYNIGSSGLYFSYSALSNIFNFGYYLFGSEYGLSFFTVTCFIFTYMIAFEFSYIITNRKRLPALLGASLIGLSQYSLWWSMVLQIPSTLAIIVCAYYFFETNNKYNKLFLAVGVALAGAMFICNLYPAWQVPFAYIILALLVWVFAVHWSQIKNMEKRDWLIMAGAFVFMCSIVCAYLFNNQNYFSAVMATEYPGARVSSGGYALDKLMTYPASLLTPYKDTGNNSEAGTFFNLFPLPVLFSLWMLLQDGYRWIIKKTKQDFDIFILLLMIPTLFILAYCSIGVPEVIAKLSLMSFSTAIRAVDILGFASTLLLIRILGMDNERKDSAGAGFVLVLASLLWALCITEEKYPSFLPVEYTACITVLVIMFGVAVFCRIQEISRKRIILAMVAAILVPGLSVLPITRGLDSVWKKPASYAVQEIVRKDPDAQWIALGGIVPPQFLISNGAPTINSNNYIPNMELWKQLDPDGDDNEVYNRYSHISVQLTEGETDFELISIDHMMLILSYDDFETADIRYIYSPYPLTEDSEIIEYTLLYAESDAYIYEVEY